jgi:hypothetical protein
VEFGAIHQGPPKKTAPTPTNEFLEAWLPPRSGFFVIWDSCYLMPLKPEIASRIVPRISRVVSKRACLACPMILEVGGAGSDLRANVTRSTLGIAHALPWSCAGS